MRSGTSPRRWPTTSSARDERERDSRAVAEHGAGGVEQLVEARQRPVRGCPPARREPRRVDDLRRGRVQALGAQQPRRAGEPAGDRQLVGVEELVVPGGRVDAGAVAALAREQAVGPRHPGRRDLDLRQALQRPLVGRGRTRRRQAPARATRRRRRRRSRRRSSPPPGSAGACRPRAAPRAGRRRGRPRAAPPSPRSPPRSGALALGLDDVLPPALGVAVAGDPAPARRAGRRAPAARGRARRTRPSCSRRAGRRSGRGPRARRRVADRPPLGREAREGIEGARPGSSGT